MFCPRCGKETESEGKFCQWCGGDMRAAPPRAVLRKKVGEISTEQYAGLARRLGSAFIDLIFLVIFDLILVGVVTVASGILLRPSPFSEALLQITQYSRHIPRTDAYGNVINAVVPNQILFSAAVLILFVPWIYFAYLESSRNQATLGKLAARIAVTDMKGNRITFARATLRFFAMFLSWVTLCVGFIIPAFTRYKQSLHDIIAGTLMFRQDT